MQIIKNPKSKGGRKDWDKRKPRIRLSLNPERLSFYVTVLNYVRECTYGRFTYPTFSTEEIEKELEDLLRYQESLTQPLTVDNGEPEGILF